MSDDSSSELFSCERTGCMKPGDFFTPCCHARLCDKHENELMMDECSNEKCPNNTETLVPKLSKSFEIMCRVCFDLNEYCSKACSIREMKNSRRSVNAFCDGACKGNPGYGGWGAAVFEDVPGVNVLYCWQSYGGKKRTTNQEMELTAMLEVLRLSPKGADIKITGDNKTVLKGLIAEKIVDSGKFGRVDSADGKGHLVFTGWLQSWIKKGWKKADGKPPSSLELWKEVVAECEFHIKEGSTLEFAWTKGHNGDPGNELADHLANLGAAEYKV